MTRSPAAIAAIGIGGCVMLSLLMRQALQAQQAQSASPLETAIRARFAGQIVGPVRVATSAVDGRSRMTVRLCVLAGLRKEPIAAAVGRAVWESLAKELVQPHEVVVAVTDDGEGELLTRSVPRPSYLR